MCVKLRVAEECFAGIHAIFKMKWYIVFFIISWDFRRYGQIVIHLGIDPVGFLISFCVFCCLVVVELMHLFDRPSSKRF